MDHALRSASQDLANELRTLLEEIDPARWRADLESAARQRADAIMERLRAIPGEVSAASDVQLMERLGQLRVSLSNALESLPSRESLESSAQRARAAWASFQRDVQPAYEALAASLRGMTLPAPAPLRPTNYKRNAFHVCCGLTVLALCEALPTRAVLLVGPIAFGLFAWGCEVSRRIWPGVNDRLMKLFSPVAHVHERHRINSSTWMVTALILLAAIPPRFAASAAIAVLALADPAAAIIGRRFGRTKLRANRSLEGTLAFFAVGTVAAFAVLSLRHSGGLLPSLAVAASAALAGALAELSLERLDDNFSIPVAAASVAWAVGALVGVA